LAGASNFGRNLAAHQGAFIMDYLEIKPNGSPNESHQFNNLWLASLLSGFLPLVPLLLGMIEFVCDYLALIV
jgi:hypothetical protein